MNDGALFRLPTWREGADAAGTCRRATEYDLAAADAVRALRDWLVAEALSLLADRLDLHPLREGADRDELEHLRAEMKKVPVPAGRAHVDWHLQRSLDALDPMRPVSMTLPQDRMRRLEAAWKHLSVAAGEGSSSLVDLSQCCCGFGHVGSTSEKRHGL